MRPPLKLQRNSQITLWNHCLLAVNYWRWLNTSPPRTIIYCSPGRLLKEVVASRCFSSRSGTACVSRVAPLCEDRAVPLCRLNDFSIHTAHLSKNDGRLDICLARGYSVAISHRLLDSHPRCSHFFHMPYRSDRDGQLYTLGLIEGCAPNAASFGARHRRSITASMGYCANWPTPIFTIFQLACRSASNSGTGQINISGGSSPPRPV
jgi:hypothetical protein